MANVNMEFREEVADWPGWFEARGEDADLHSTFFNAAARYGHIADRVPSLKRAYYVPRTPAYARRRRRIQQILGKEYGIDAPIRFVEHHYAHAASAYFTGNFDQALIVTMDGGGDRHCSHVYSVKNGVFEKLNVRC